MTRIGGQIQKHDLSWARWPLALIFCALPFVPLHAAEPQQQLKRVEEQIDSDTQKKRSLEAQTGKLREDLDKLRSQLIDLAAQSQAQENDLDRIETDTAALEERERDETARLEAERQRIAGLIGAFVRMARLPPEAVIARPQGPLDTLRSALLLRDTIPPLKERAAALSKILADLAETRASLDRQRAEATAARAALDKRRAEIERLVSRREDLLKTSADEHDTVQKRMAKLTDQASDLRQLMEKIEQDRRTAGAAAVQREMERLEAARREAEEKRLQEQREAEKKEAARKEAEKREAERKDAEKQRLAAVPPAEAPPSAAATLGGGLQPPVAGKVTVRFGESDHYGSTARGLTISSRAGASVVAPATGTVVFAGPFRGYGLILIVDHGNGYHSLIAGLGRIDATVGRVVAGGEPIGQMPSPADSAPDLYFELRRHGQPTNPQRGFGATEAKGHG